MAYMQFCSEPFSAENDVRCDSWNLGHGHRITAFGRRMRNTQCNLRVYTEIDGALIDETCALLWGDDTVAPEDFPSEEEYDEYMSRSMFEEMDDYYTEEAKRMVDAWIHGRR